MTFKTVCSNAKMIERLDALKADEISMLKLFSDDLKGTSYNIGEEIRSWLRNEEKRDFFIRVFGDATSLRTGHIAQALNLYKALHAHEDQRAVDPAAFKALGHLLAPQERLVLARALGETSSVTCLYDAEETGCLQPTLDSLHPSLIPPKLLLRFLSSFQDGGKAWESADENRQRAVDERAIR